MASKPDPAGSEIPKTDDPKEFLLSVMNHAGLDAQSRIEAAAALMPYFHQPLAEDEDDDD